MSDFVKHDRFKFAFEPHMPPLVRSDEVVGRRLDDVIELRVHDVPEGL